MANFGSNPNQDRRFGASVRQRHRGACDNAELRRIWMLQHRGLQSGFKVIGSWEAFALSTRSPTGSGSPARRWELDFSAGQRLGVGVSAGLLNGGECSNRKCATRGPIMI